MKYILALALALTFSVVSGQSYENAIGLRGGIGSGITFKHDFGGFTGEALVYARTNVANITALVEFYKPLSSSVGEFNFYYGFGGHIGSYTYKVDERNETNTTIGVDGIIGIEYNFQEVPINASLDWKPEFNLVGFNGSYFDGVALSVRYYW